MELPALDHAGLRSFSLAKAHGRARAGPGEKGGGWIWGGGWRG